MNRLISLIFLLYIILNLPPASAFASWLPCDTELMEGEMIMGQPAQNSNERFIQIFRGDSLIAAEEAYYVPGVALEVQLSQDFGQFVVEVRPFPASFRQSTCKHSCPPSIVLLKHFI